jgi:5-methylthioadenosine/S-adenosylhomocysteine deaminase
MLFCDIDYLTPDFEVAHGYVGTIGQRIAYVGASDPTVPVAAGEGSAAAAAEAEALAAMDFGERYDGRGKLVMPGLYNAHAHAPMTLLRGYAEDLPLQSWLNDRVFPFEAHINDERAQAATLLAIAEMLRFGTVSFSDMYYFEDGRIAAIGQGGIKCNICNGLICPSDVDYNTTPAYAVDKRLVEEWNGTLDGRLLVDLCVHAEYTTSPTIVRTVGEAAAAYGVHTHIHMSETKSEHEECKARHGGLTPAAYFDSLGFFEQPCTAAHCVWTEPEDWALMARKGVTAALNPASNLKLGSGFAPVAGLLDAGVNVALGTDGMASNNNHDMFRDLYLLATVYKGATLDPTTVTPAQALRAATRGGAIAQGRDDCGQLACGYRADLAVLDTSAAHAPWMHPAYSTLNNLVYSAEGTDVVLTMVDGRVLYRDGEWPTIDVERAAAQTAAATQAIIAEL